ncbi:MarR family transcriptional regulator [Kineosporia sp. NBRC 101731]|uniref:MarR family winged helix-turn-helix transcriptional regulator n=1 Tax=Kineosporia sp. NBRC 101731 TaxID=3032199 RepID=UPI0024A0EB46|nr:MarR family transcriptional regulator [Kineosporia sp. NBRC 101731]GLY29353.1 transcriptional regulator [Kineosporia sp. NBRC 101731]
MSDDTPWLTPEQTYRWMHVVAASSALPTAIEHQLKRDAGLNFFEYSVLSGLSQAPERAMKMCELAMFSHGSPSRLSHAVSRMERAGWVQRRSCMEGPLRSVEAVLTDAGYDKIVEAAPAHVREARRLVVDALTEQELQQLQHALRKILRVASPPLLDVIDASFANAHPTADAHDTEPTGLC